MYSLNWPINIGTCNKNLVRVILILDLNAIFSGLQNTTTAVPLNGEYRRGL